MKIGWVGVGMLGLLAVTGGDVIDRIAAVVNEDIILLSEVEEKMFILQQSGQLQDKDSTQVVEIRRDILDRLIEEKLVVQRARSQGIEVDDSEVIGRVNEAMSKVRSQFPSTQAFRDALAQEGITENMLRERYQTDIQQEILGQRIVGREVRSKVQISSDDVRQYFDENRDDLPQRPLEVHMAHIVMHPVSEERERKALDVIEAARERIVAGESFEEVAKEVSDDPSKTRGGMLGTFSPGDLDSDFEAAVDTLEVNELSEPVRTRYGYHLIEVLGRDGPSFQVRHILRRIEPETTELESARKRAVAARERIVAGESFEDVAREVSDDEATRESGGDLGWTPAKFLVPGVKEVVDTLEVGEISPVVASDQGFHVFKVVNRRMGGAYEFDEIKDRLRGFLEQTKLEEVYDEWMAGIRDSSYIDIRAWVR